MWKQILRKVYFASRRPALNTFVSKLKNPQDTQLQKLKSYAQNFPSLSGISSYEEFAKKIPLSRYETWADALQSKYENGSTEWDTHTIKRWELSSGSTFKRKTIPYTQIFTSELDQALSTWMSDLSSQYSSIRNGSQYWSLSWCPPLLRNKAHATQDDSELFSPLQRLFLKNIFAVPTHVGTLESEELWWQSTLQHLLEAKDLSLISVWSPTFLISILKETQKRKAKLQKHFKKNPNSHHIVNALEHIESDPQLSTSVIWPQLKLISCWDSSTSNVFIPEIKKFFPNVEIQGKGLWATEGVVTLPFQKKKILSIGTHFYEFRSMDDGKIKLPHELSIGETVEPILSTGNALWRYCLGDRMQVKSFEYNSVPTFEFLGRDATSDMVGEKLHTSTLEDILQTPELKNVLLPYCLAIKARNSSKAPYYCFLSEKAALNINEVSLQIEKNLLEHHHYSVARQLGQLGHCQVLQAVDLSQTSLELLKNNTHALAGQKKLETLISVFEDELELRISKKP